MIPVGMGQKDVGFEGPILVIGKEPPPSSRIPEPASMIKAAALEADLVQDVLPP